VRVGSSSRVGDVRVVEGGEQLRLALEAGEALGILRQLGRHHLDRDLAAELRVGGAVHLAYASRAEGCGDSVVGEVLADQVRRIIGPLLRASPQLALERIDEPGPARLRNIEEQPWGGDEWKSSYAT